jgi:hypothetical protein
MYIGQLTVSWYQGHGIFALQYFIIVQSFKDTSTLLTLLAFWPAKPAVAEAE